MAYTNSPLAKIKYLGKNYYNHRNGLLGIIPHCVVGKMSGPDAWGYFHGTNNASCNYYIEDDGIIWCFVPEWYSAWTTSSYIADTNHITVEIASGKTHPYAISEAAYKSLIKLTADVYKRNGISKCIWDRSKKYDSTPGGVPMHRNYKNKACPGDYIVNKYATGDFCKRVNAILGGESMDEVKQPASKAVNDFGIKYKAHCQAIGNCTEVHDGQIAGTVGLSKRLEALTITCPDGMKVSAKAHIQRKGWVTYDAAKEITIGTTGEALRLEAFELNFEGVPKDKTVKYAAHIQSIGWTNSENHFPIGTMGQSLRIEAVKIWCE